MPLYINDITNGRKYKADKSYWVNVDGDTIDELKKALGSENIVVKYR